MFIPAVAGVLIGLLIGYTTNYFTSDLYYPAKTVARYSNSGSAISIITGFSYGLLSIVPSIVGDTVGDPFKDTAGPSPDTLITVVSLVSSVVAPLIAVQHVF